MKDLTITARRLKIEFGWMAGAFIAANLCNAWAIWHYGASFKEMLTSFFYVLTFAFFLYVITAVVRLVLRCALKLVFRKHSHKTTINPIPKQEQNQ